MPSVRVTQLPGLYLSPFPPLSFPPTQNPRACSPPSLPTHPSLIAVIVVVVNVVPRRHLFSSFVSLFLFPLFVFRCNPPLKSPSRRTQLGKTIIICARVPSTPPHFLQNPTIVAALVFLCSSFFYPSCPTLKTALSLTESWTHYVVIYERDNGAWQPSTRRGNPLVSCETSGRARMVDHRNGSKKPVYFIPCSRIFCQILLYF